MVDASLIKYHAAQYGIPGSDPRTIKVLLSLKGETTPKMVAVTMQGSNDLDSLDRAAGTYARRRQVDVNRVVINPLWNSAELLR